MTNGDDVIRYARQCLGKPYVWGATGPDSFDCSGLVQWSFQHAGYSGITRTTYTQVTQGQAVSSPLPGDLWFPESGHVGIATSPTTVIHAPETGQPVKEVNMWTSKPVAIRRLVPPGSGTGSISDGGSSGSDGVATSLGGLFSGVDTLFEFLTDPKMWLRVGIFVAGLGFTGAGLFITIMGMEHARQAAKTISNHAKKLVPEGTVSDGTDAN